jgi:hypothetical protein
MRIPRLEARELTEVSTGCVDHVAINRACREIARVLRWTRTFSRVNARIAEYDPATTVDIGEGVEDVGEIAGGQTGYAGALAVNAP